VRNYLSWIAAFVCVLAALVVLGAPLRSWVAFLGIAVVIVVGLVVEAIARRRQTRLVKFPGEDETGSGRQDCVE
jgi:cell division protein FtsW (lipid II flippase)